MAINFSDKDKISGAWIKWETIGTKVQGTLIGKRQKPDTYDSTKMQWIYELLTEEDEIVIVGGKPGIDMQMKHIRLGQIVELRYEGDKPSTTPGYDPTKLIQVYTNKEAMDKEWLAQNSEMALEGELPQEVSNNEGEIKVENIPMKEAPITTTSPATSASAPATGTVDEAIAELSALAKMKMKIEKEEDVQRMIMENTGLAFIASNFPNIKEKMEAMPNI